MDPAFLGRIQCFNINKQCSHGEGDSYQLMTNPRLEQAFEEGCQQQKGKMIRCCPLSLINKPYHSTKGKIPIHVKRERDNYRVCPQSITSSCVREADENNLALCVAQKCNDAGYLEAFNYYQICKAYKRKGEMEETPDCPSRNCQSMMTNLTIDPNQQPIVPPPPAKSSTDQKKSTGVTLGDLLDKLPKGDKFYQQGAMILGGVAILIILIIIIVFPLTPKDKLLRLIN